MSKFKANKTIDLAFAGDGWAGSTIVVSIPTMAEVQTIAVAKAPEDLAAAEAQAQAVMAFLQDHFVSGTAPVDGKLVDLVRDDIPELPLNVIAELREQLTGSKVLSPNS